MTLWYTFLPPYKPHWRWDWRGVWHEWEKNKGSYRILLRGTEHIHYFVKLIRQCHYRPGQALRFPGGWGSQISRQSGHEGGKVVSPTHRPPLPQTNIPGTHFCQSLSQPQGHSAAGRIMSKKIRMTLSGIEPATLRLVPRCLNQLRHRVPHSWTCKYIKE
jgi:hypothetical protein